jgi:Glycine-zipper domain
MKHGTRTLASVVFVAVTGGALAQETPPVAQPAAGPSPAASAGVIAYPAKGQAAAQQAADESDCYDWSKTQTGYDPKNPPKVVVATAEPESSAPSGERVKGAVRGAAAGAVIGEVADNDASRGAEVGAAAGVVAGGHRTRKARRDQKAQAEEQAKAATQATQDAGVDAFKRGLSACLESRGYTVK